MRDSEQTYIRLRKLKAWGNSLCFYFCRIFPVKKNLVCVCTFEGKGGFGCNPKYIVQELHRQNPKIEFVWLVNDMSKTFPAYIKKAPNTTWGRAYWMSRAKVWIDNYRTRYGTKKRKGQYYLNTNHYTLGIKTVGLWRGTGFSKMAYLVSKADSDMIDDLIIDSAFCEEMCPKGLVYDGSYLKTGAPRCDILYGDRTQERTAFRQKHGILQDAKVVMFAPTFREGAKDGKRSIYSQPWSIDFERLLQALERKFGGVWYLCVRVHPQLAPMFQAYRNDVIQARLIDESKADDMYEILAAMDAYITDYSSACFEAGYAGIPVFLYTDDIDDYKDSRGALFWDMRAGHLDCVTLNLEIFKTCQTTLPFSVAIDNDELERHIDDFNETQYRLRLNRFHSDIALIFRGNASSKIGERLNGILC